MEILVQEDLSKPSSRKVYAQISTRVLTLEDIIQSVRDIIDDEENGYYRLPFMSARSESLQRLDVYTSLRRTRADRAFVLSNGKNTIYMLDYVVKAQRVFHDPILCIIGPEAEKIAESALKRLSKILLFKTYEVKFNDEAIRDFSNIMKYKKSEVIAELSETFEEAELALKMKLLRDNDDGKELVPTKNSISKELLEEIRERSIFVERIDLRNIIPFGILAILMILLLIILMRL